MFFSQFQPLLGVVVVRLQFKLALIIFVFGLLSLPIISGIYYYHDKDSYLLTQQQTLLKIAKQHGERLDLLLESKADVVSTLAAAPLVLSTLEESNEHFAKLPTTQRNEWIKKLNEQWRATSLTQDPFIKPYLNNPVAQLMNDHQNRRHGEYGEIFLTNRFGAMIATTGKLTTLAHSHKYWWVAGFNQGKGRVFFDDRGFDESVAGYVLGVVVPVMREGKLLGIIKANINIIGAMDRLIENNSVGQTGQIKIVRSGGKVVLEKGREPLSAQLSAEIVQVMESRSEGSFVHEVNDMIVALYPVSTTLGGTKAGFGGKYESIDHILGNRGEAWFFHLSQKRSEALRELTEHTTQMLLTGFVLISLLGLLAWLIGRSLAKPVVQLESSVEQVGQGNFEVVAKVSGNNEIGRLAQAFNQMTENLRATTTSKGC
jgi:HAMP domain-containing protein